MVEYDDVFMYCMEAPIRLRVALATELKHDLYNRCTGNVMDTFCMTKNDCYTVHETMRFVLQDTCQTPDQMPKCFIRLYDRCQGQMKP